MSQDDIIQCLKKSDKPLSRTEIALSLNEVPDKISKTLRRILKDPNSEVKVIEINRIQAMKIYKCKRRMRCYIIYD